MASNLKRNVKIICTSKSKRKTKAFLKGNPAFKNFHSEVLGCFLKHFCPLRDQMPVQKIQLPTYNEGRAKQPNFKVMEFCTWLRALTSLLFQDLRSWRSLQMWLQSTWGSFFCSILHSWGLTREHVKKHSYFDQWTDCSDSGYGCSSKIVIVNEQTLFCAAPKILLFLGLEMDYKNVWRGLIRN